MYSPGARYQPQICKDQQFQNFDLNIKTKHWEFRARHLCYKSKHGEESRIMQEFVSSLGRENRKEPSLGFLAHTLCPRLWNQRSPRIYLGDCRMNLARERETFLEKSQHSQKSQALYRADLTEGGPERAVDFSMATEQQGKAGQSFLCFQEKFRRIGEPRDARRLMMGKESRQCLNPTQAALAGEAKQVKGDDTEPAGPVTTQRDGTSEDAHGPIRACLCPEAEGWGQEY